MHLKEDPSRPEAEHPDSWGIKPTLGTNKANQTCKFWS